MESRVLYEASFTFQPVLLFVLAFPAVGLLTAIQNRKKEQEGGKATNKISAVIVGFGFVVLLAVAVLVIPDQVKMYDSTVGAYKRGEYQIVEGYVENFHPMPSTGHDEESFTISGVRFSYSDFTQSWGYHNARSRGGVITGDGQHLRIGYTKYGWLGNVIVSIEELPETQAE